MTRSGLTSVGQALPPDLRPAGRNIGRWDRPSLRVLTVRQPWASAIIFGPKSVENRKFAVRRRDINDGLYIAIHAGLQWDDGMEAGGLAALWPEVPLERESYPTGVILGVVQVVDVANIERDPMHQAALDPWACGPVCWVLGQKWPCRRPVPFRGRRGLQILPSAVARQVRQEVKAYQVEVGA